VGFGGWFWIYVGLEDTGMALYPEPVEGRGLRPTRGTLNMGYAGSMVRPVRMLSRSSSRRWVTARLSSSVGRRSRLPVEMASIKCLISPS